MLNRSQDWSLVEMWREIEVSRRMLSFLGPLDRCRDLTTDETLVLLAIFSGVEPGEEG